jgi:hypothetical protein
MSALEHAKDMLGWVARPHQPDRRDGLPAVSKKQIQWRLKVGRRGDLTTVGVGSHLRNVFGVWRTTIGDGLKQQLGAPQLLLSSPCW